METLTFQYGHWMSLFKIYLKILGLFWKILCATDFKCIFACWELDLRCPHCFGPRVRMVRRVGRACLSVVNNRVALLSWPSSVFCLFLSFLFSFHPSIHPFIYLPIIYHFFLVWQARWLWCPCLLLCACPGEPEPGSRCCVAGGARGPGAVQQFQYKFSPARSALGKLSSAPPRAGNLSPRAARASQARRPPLPVSLYLSSPTLRVWLALGGPPPHAPTKEFPFQSPGLLRSPAHDCTPASLLCLKGGRARLLASPSATGWSFLSDCLSGHAPEIRGWEQRPPINLAPWI